MKKFVAAALAAALCMPAANAAVTNGTASVIKNGTSLPATFVKLSVPFGNLSSPDNTVGNDNFDHDQIFYAFDEKQSVMLVNPLSVETNSGMTTLSSGTMVDSHYVFFDPASMVEATATIHFSGNILGVLTTTAALRATDALLGADGINYADVSSGGLEADDVFVISGSKLTVNLRAMSPGDYIRVLTEGTAAAPVPLPGAAVFFLTALGGGLILRARKSTQ